MQQGDTNDSPSLKYCLSAISSEKIFNEYDSRRLAGSEFLRDFTYCLMSIVADIGRKYFAPYNFMFN